MADEKPQVMRELAREAKRNNFSNNWPVWDRRIRIASYLFAGSAGLLTFWSMGDLDASGREHCFTGLWYRLRTARDSFFLAALPGGEAAHTSTAEQPTRPARAIAEAQHYAPAVHWGLRFEPTAEVEARIKAAELEGVPAVVGPVPVPRKE